MQTINENQKTVLTKIVDGKQHAVTDFDKRTVGALARRDFVKLLEKKSGEFVKITAKGKKVLN